MQELIRETQDLLGFTLSAEQLAAFETYRRELEAWNTRANLTAIRDPEEVRRKHFLDSLSCLLVMEGTPMGRVVDVGSGAGFPGLPLKIVQPDIHLTLIESVTKKTAFLEHIVQVLDLGGVEVLTLRAEEAGRMPEHRESYDCALARAVAPMAALAEYLLPLVKVGGRMLAQKGESGPRELEEAREAIRVLGGKPGEVFPVNIPGVEERRYLVVVEKVGETPEKYPRRVGIPGKRPL